MYAKSDIASCVSEDASDVIVRSNVLDQLQMLRSLDELDERLTKRKEHLNQLKVSHEMFDKNHVLLQSFQWLQQFAQLLETFLKKESSISLFLLQNVTQNKHDVKLQLPVRSHDHVRQLLHNLAQFESTDGDAQDLQIILKSQSYLQASKLESLEQSVIYFKETLQKVKQAEKYATLNGSSLDPQLLSKFNEFASQIDCQITLMSLVLNKNVL